MRCYTHPVGHYVSLRLAGRPNPLVLASPHRHTAMIPCFRTLPEGSERQTAGVSLQPNRWYGLSPSTPSSN